MASQYPPKKNTAYTHYFSLYKNDGTLIVNPGTYTKKVSVDGAAIADIAASVTEEDATYGQLSIVIAAGEMNGDHIWGMIKDDTAGCVPHVFVLNTAAYTLDEIMAEIAKIPKSDSNVSWNATALGAINAEVDTALNTAIPGSPTADSINERIVNMEATEIPAIKTVVDTIQADTDLLDDAAGGIADIHTDVASARTEIAAVKIVVDTIQADTDLLDDVSGGLADIHTDIGSARTEIGAVKTVVDTIQADTDLLDDAIGGLADIHADIGSARTEIGAVKTVVDTIQADTDLLDDAAGGLADIHTDIGTALTELAKVPKSDSNVSWNATAIGAMVDAILDESIETDHHGSFAVGAYLYSLGGMSSNLTTIMADTDLLDDVSGGLADIHTDIAAVKSETAELKAAVITNAAGTDIAADIIALKAETVSILADTNELQLEFVDGGRLDLLIDSILADTDELQTDWVNGGRLDLLIDAQTAELAKVPKSDSNVTWNATALASINAEVDTALNTAIPGSPTSGSVNERLVTIQGDTDLLDDAIGGLADIHTDIGSARTEIGAVKTVVDTIQADTDLLDDAIGGLADIHADIATMQGNVTDILADTNELQLEFVDGGRLDLLIDGILADTGELQTDWANGGRLDLLLDQAIADTDELQIALTDGGRLDLLIDQILADTNELQTDNVNGGRTDLLIDSIITKVDALAVATIGLGACTWAYTLTDSVTMLPIEGAEVWVTTDLAGTHMVAHGYTNASGIVTFFLDAGTNYFWRQHGSYTFTNPDTEIVS